MTDRPVQIYLQWLIVALAFAIAFDRQWTSILSSLIMLLWFMDGRVREKTLRILRDPLWMALLLFIGINLLSLLWTSEPGEGSSYLFKYRYLLLAPMIATCLNGRYRLAVGRGFVAGTLAALVLSAGAMLGLIETDTASVDNPAVTMSHLDFSMILAVAALLVLTHALGTNRGLRTRLLLLVVFVVIVGGLVLNIGRSGQFAFFGALLVMAPLLWLRRSAWRASAAVLGVIASLVLLHSLVPVFQQRIDAAVFELGEAFAGREYETNQGKRIAGMIVATQMIRNDPVLGTGVGANMPEFRRLLDTAEYQQFRSAVAWFPHLHNQYFQVATEVGLVGLLVMLNIFVQIFRRPWPDRGSKRAAWMIALAYLFGFFGDPFLQKQLPLVLFATSLGVLAVAAPRSEDEPSLEPSNSANC